VKLALADFRDENAAAVLGWVRTVQEAADWASVPFLRLRPAIFEEWHAEHGVVPSVGLLDGEPCAYGEIWEDREQREAELARIIVAPTRRGQGIGRAFVARLAAEARGRGFADVWVRVVPGNEPAIACYRAAGFVRASAEVEHACNLEQERDYVWMQLEPAPGLR
jgi:ribosomal-protein-alanine N-acetyltransferase